MSTGASITAMDATTANSRIGNVSNAPETDMLDGKQYLRVAAGDMLAAFAVYGPQAVESLS